MLQRIYGTVWATQEELDLYLWRREEARKRDHRRLGVAARPVQLPRRQPGLGVLAPQGPAAVAHARGRDARAPGPPRLPGGLARRSSSSERLWEQSGHWDHYDENMFLVESEGQDVQPQAHELPREHVHLPEPRALLPRPAAALRRVRPAPPQRALGRRCRADAGAPVHPGRRPHLRPPRPARRRARRRCSARSARPTAGSGWSRASRSRRDPDKAHRRPGALGARRGAHPRRRSTGVGHQLRGQAQGRHVLRAQDRHLHRRRARPRVADGDDPGRPR